MYIVHTWYVHCTYVFGLTSSAWPEVLSEFPHSKISVLSGRFFWRMSRRSIAFCCNSGISGSGMPDWRDAIFQSMHWMSTSTISSLGSATWGDLYRREPALAASIALLMSTTCYMHVCTLFNHVYTMYTQVHNIPREQWGHEPRKEESAWAFSCGHQSSLHPPCHQFKCHGNGQHTQGTRLSLRCRPPQLRSGLPTVSTLPQDEQW